MHRDLESRLQTSTEDLATMKKSARFSDEAAARAAKELNAEIVRLNTQLEMSLNSAQKMDEDLVVLRSETASLKEKLKVCEASEREKTEDCSSLVQQLAEGELRAEEMDINLKRIRAERDEAKKTKSELAVKMVSLETECVRLTKQMSTFETESERKRSHLEEKLESTRVLLAKESDVCVQLNVQLKDLENKLLKLEDSNRSLEVENAKTISEMTKQRDLLSEQLIDANRIMEDLAQGFNTEKESLRIELKQIQLAQGDSLQQVQAREKRVAMLEQELVLAKEHVNEMSEQIKTLKGVDQKLTATQARCDKVCYYYLLFYSI
jgi:chromosome segregation ATPase